MCGKLERRTQARQNTEVTCAAESNLEVNFKVRLYEGSIEKSSDSNSSASLTFKKIGGHFLCVYIY